MKGGVLENYLNQKRAQKWLMELTQLQKGQPATLTHPYFGQTKI
jgi:hypothetical protein